MREKALDMSSLPVGSNRPDLRAPERYSGPEHYSDPKKPRQSYWVRVAVSLSGSAAATAIGRTLTSPLERIKILMQSQPLLGTYPVQPPITGFSDGCRRIYQREGFAALFRGNGINCLRIVPTTFLRFAIFDRTKNLLQSGRQAKEIPPDLASPGPVFAVSDPKAIPTPDIVILNAEYPRGKSGWAVHMKDESSTQPKRKVEDQYPVEQLKETARDISIRLASGALSGTLTLALVYPLDTLHTVLTADTTPKGHPRLYNGIANCAYKFVKHDGLFALYKGLAPSWIGAMLYSAASFTAYDLLTAYFTKPVVNKGGLLGNQNSVTSDGQMELSFFLKFGLGVVSGLLGQSLTYPLDTIRRRLQLHHALGMRQDIKYNGVIDCWRQIVTRESSGYRALYRGLTVNAFKTSICAGVQFIVYDWLQASVLKPRYHFD